MKSCERLALYHNSVEARPCPYSQPFQEGRGGYPVQEKGISSPGEGISSSGGDVEISSLGG